MRINNESLCTLVNSRDLREEQIYFTKKSIELAKLDNSITNDEMGSLKHKITFHEQNGFRVLVFSNNAKNNLINYTIPKDIRLDVLKSLPNRKDVIQIDEHNCIKYIKTEDRICAIKCYRKNKKQIGKTNDDFVHVFFFTIDLINGKVVHDRTNTYDGEFIENKEAFIEKFYSLFILVVTYLELADITTEIFLGTANSKNNKSNLNFANSSRFNIIYVNSNWNTEKIIIGDVQVRGHWRLQPYGIGRTQYKFIFIEPFKKGITRRLAQKELVN